MHSTVKTILHGLKRLVVVLAIALLCSSCRDLLPPVSNNPWQLIALPTTANLLDIAFSTPEHGWIVGNRATVFESTNGGKTWQQRNFDLEDDVNYRLSSVSFSGSEGWIVGQPSILLHTMDDGKSWEKVALSSKLPGSPDKIVALGAQQAEMVTDVGAIYRTVDAGRNWKALVQDAVGVMRNISRSPDGRYVAVSAKGNFYSTWEPGQQVWVGHNRNSSRRVQNMGFAEDGRLWMLARGGRIQFTSDPKEMESWTETIAPESVNSWGLLDLAYRTPNEIWASGGSGTLLVSNDGGQTWQRDREVENVPSNLDRIVFFSPERGFVLGQRGTLLRYVKPA
jgi:photosystem II stability/assembly factor-like uncharacterized protein